MQFTEGGNVSSREKTKFRLRLKASDESRRFEPFNSNYSVNAILSRVLRVGLK